MRHCHYLFTLHITPKLDLHITINFCKFMRKIIHSHKLKKKPQLIVGSAGRILELIEMKKLKVPSVATVVVDEADRVLFGESLAVIRDILKTIPGKPQLVFVSATEQTASSAEAASDLTVVDAPKPKNAAGHDAKGSS